MNHSVHDTNPALVFIYFKKAPQRYFQKPPNPALAAGWRRSFLKESPREETQFPFVIVVAAPRGIEPRFPG